MIQIPPDAVIVRDARLTAIAALVQLSGKHLKELKSAVKKSMAEKKAGFAQSNLAHARLGKYEPTKVNPAKLYKLVEEGKLKLADFLACIEVHKEPLAKHLPGKQIEALSDPAPGGEVGGAGSLFCEFKPGVIIDLDRLEKALVDGVKQQLEEEIPETLRTRRRLSARAG